MENSKFDQIYKENIITEKYHRHFGFWNASKAGKAIGNMLKSAIGKKFSGNFNDLFLPKKWFDFKKQFKDNFDLNIINYGVANCKIHLKSTVELNGVNAKNFIYGENPEETIENGKQGGLIFNREFETIFEKLGYIVPKKSSDIQEELSSTKINELKLTFTLLISFNKPTFVENVKQAKRINPNYLKSIKGNVFFIFNNQDDYPINVGTCEYFQSRYANMDPPKPLKDQIKDMWDKPNKDFGLLGSLVAKGIGSATTAIAGGLFSKTVQEENFDLDIDEKFSFSNNRPGGDIGSKSSDVEGEKIYEKMNDYFNNLTTKIENPLIEFNITNASDRKYEISVSCKNNEKNIVLAIIEMEIK
jgi:hypothetical protein